MSGASRCVLATWLSMSSRHAALAASVATILSNEWSLTSLAVWDRECKAPDVDGLSSSAVAKLRERPSFDLAHPLASDGHGATDLLESHSFWVRFNDFDGFGVLPPFKVKPWVEARTIEDSHRSALCELQSLPQNADTDSHRVATSSHEFRADCLQSSLFSICDDCCLWDMKEVYR